MLRLLRCITKVINEMILNTQHRLYLNLSQHFLILPREKEIFIFQCDNSLYTLVLLANAYLRKNGGLNFSKYYNEDIFQTIFHFRKFSLNFK